MNKKLVSILLCMLLIASSIATINILYTVKGIDNPPESNGSNLLDTNYIWNWTKLLANVTYKAYPQDEIPRGRSFGSLGGEYTKNKLLIEMDDNLNLSDVHPEQIKHINWSSDTYSDIINVTDFNLNISSSDAIPFENPIPKKEMFAIQTENYSRNSDNWNGSFKFNNTLVVPKDMTKYWPFAGSYNDYHLNVSNYEFLSDYQFFFSGNITYLTSNDAVPAPEDQYDNVYMLDDVANTQEKLDDLTCAEAAIIVQSGDLPIQNIDASNSAIPVVNISGSNGDKIKELLKDGMMFVDNAGNNGTNLTFTYNLTEGLWPDAPFVLIDRIPNHVELWDYMNHPFQHPLYLSWVIALKLKYPDFGAPNINAYLSCVNGVSKRVKFLSYLPCHWNKQCKGVILYDTYDCHFMISGPWYTEALPCFTVNNSVGVFLNDHHDDTTISGNINQTYLSETAGHCGGIGYNVMGNITVNENPGAPTIILSNRYDGMWGQTEGDAGVGAAILLGIAKYFKINSITPKYNIQFLFTTGEEYGFLGARHFIDNHNYTIKDWFTLEQLAFKQSDTALCLNYNTHNSTLKKILNEIVNETHYYNRTHYENLSQAINELGSEQGVANTTVTDFSLCLSKDQDYRWDGWHRTGSNYTKGDCLNNTDRKDINISSELFWNITKYFCVNPNCHFHTVTYEATNTTGGTAPDSIKATFTVKSVLPSDLVLVNVSLYNATTHQLVPNKYQEINFIINKEGVERNITLSMPPGVKEGDYYIKLQVFNSTARINRALGFTNSSNDTDTSPTFHLNKYHTLGDIRIGTSNANVHNIIRGSEFTVTEDARVHNITAYVDGNVHYPPDDPIYQCMIYRVSDGHLMGASNQVACSTLGWHTFTFTTKPLLVHNTQYMLSVWGDNDDANVYATPQYQGNGYVNSSYTFGTPPQTIAWHTYTLQQYSLFCRYTLDTTPPKILNVTASPHIIGFGYNVTITANVTDNGSGVNLVKVHISNPGYGTNNNYTMAHISGNMYRYIFTNTWTVGQYNYSIWAQDNDNNTNTSTGYHFHVSAYATISIATLKDTYGDNQDINITDPPNSPDTNITMEDRGLTWNKYYNASSGDNILEAYQGPVNYQNETNNWVPINSTLQQLLPNELAYTYGYRAGNNRGLYNVYFKPNAQNDWPVAFAYNKSTNPTTQVIRSKLIGVGYVDPQSNWAYQFLQNVQSSQGQTNRNSITYTNVFTGTDVAWTYDNAELKEAITLSNVTKTLLQSHPPSQYGLHDASSYLVFITKLDYQNLNLYNTSGLLTGNVTISNLGVDFKDALGYFKAALPLGDAYELNNESVRQKLTFRIIRLHGETYLLSGLRVTDLNSMNFPVVIDPTLTVYSSSNDGYIYNSNTNYNTARNASTGTISSTAISMNVGQYKQINFPITYFIDRGFLFFNTTTLPSSAYIDNATLSLYKQSDSSTTDFLITVQNGQPTYPHSPLQSGDYYYKDYSGNGGTLNTNSFGNGYNNIYLNSDGKSWMTKTGWTKLCLRSSRDINDNTPTGNEFISVYTNEKGSGYQPKLVITYRNQSKIKNTGSTDIKGYLSIQIWRFQDPVGPYVLYNDTVNETTPRTILQGQQLGLDTIFNGLITTYDLGTGYYEVRARFRDPDGNTLHVNGNHSLETMWGFTYPLI